LIFLLLSCQDINGISPLIHSLAHSIHAACQDFYDISLVNAYNTPARIRPLNPPYVRCGQRKADAARLSLTAG
jgi:hypothetical protein